MTTPDNDSRIANPIELARELDQTIGRINELFAFRRRMNHIIFGLVIAVVIDIGISVTFILFFSALHHAQLQACHNTNNARQAQISLWSGLVHNFGPPHPTKAEQAQDKKIVAFVSRKFAPIDCSKL